MTGPRKLLDDCFLHDKDRLRHDECLALILDRLGRVVEPETLPTGDIHGRFLAETVTAPRNIPLHTNAAVDGFAFSSASLPAEGGSLPVSARIAAGDLNPSPLQPGTAARISLQIAPSTRTAPSAINRAIRVRDSAASAGTSRESALSRRGGGLAAMVKTS